MTDLTVRETLERHWPDYLKEAWGLAMFMTFASIFTTLLEYPHSPIHQALPSQHARLAVLGLGMGIVLAGIVYSPWGQKSGAHINPAVTWAFFRVGKITLRDALFYTLAQFAGAIAAVQLMRVLIGSPYRHSTINHAVTRPGPEGAWVAFGAEFVISFVLMYVVLIAVNNARLEKWTGAIVASLIAVYLAIETPYSGMSLNPARTFGSAFAAQYWSSLWVYFTAPMIATWLAAELYLRVHDSHPSGVNYPVHKAEA